MTDKALPPAISLVALDTLPRVSLRAFPTGPYPALIYAMTATTANSRRTCVLSLRRAMQILSPNTRAKWRGDPTSPDPMRRDPVLYAPWHHLSALHVQAIVGQIAQSGAASSTVQVTWYHLFAVLKSAWHLGLYSDEQIKRLDSLPRLRTKRAPANHWLGLFERQRLWNSCDPRTPIGRRDRMFLALADVHALRRAECASLCLEDLSPDRARFTVTRKGGDRDTLSFTTQTRMILDQWLLTRGEWPGPLLCPITQRGIAVHHGVTSDRLFKLLQSKTKALGIQNVSPHDLRAGAITDLLAGGIDIALVAKLAGHSSITTTQRYDRRGDAALATAAAARTIPVDVDADD